MTHLAMMAARRGRHAMPDEEKALRQARMKALRARFGWTQEELAERAGIARTLVNKLERGGNNAGGSRTMIGLTIAFGVSGLVMEGYLDGAIHLDEFERHSTVFRSGERGHGGKDPGPPGPRGSKRGNVLMLPPRTHDEESSVREKSDRGDDPASSLEGMPRAQHTPIPKAKPSKARRKK